MLSGLNHITIAVSDLDISFAFYSRLLEFKPHVRWDSGAYLSLGNLWLCLSLDTAKPAEDYSHIALDCDDRNFPKITERLRSAKIIEWKKNTSEGDSLYFLDPDGHKLEIHCGNLQSRLNSVRENPYGGLEWF
jgi:catechol 2,3-dioxygenase-like lactoylglutathione lyase family enzyme